MDNQNSDLTQAINNFIEKHPNQVINRIEKKLFEDFTRCVIYYTNFESDVEHTYTTDIRNPILSKKEISEIKRKVRNQYRFNFESIKILVDKNDSNRLYIIVNDHIYNEVLVLFRDTKRIKRLVETRKVMQFEDLLIYLRFNYSHHNFYFDVIKSADHFTHSESNLDKKLFLIYKSSEYNGLLPSFWRKDFEQSKPIDFRSLWDNNKFLPDVNIKDPHVFDTLIISNSVNRGDAETYWQEESEQASFMRIYLKRLREKHLIKGLEFNKTTKDYHYVYSAIKTYTDYNNGNYSKMTLDLFMKIWVVSYKRINNAIKYLVDNGLIESQKLSQGTAYKTV